jgi:hypothetical protein
MASNRLALPPEGLLSAALGFSQPLMRLPLEDGPIWLVIDNRYTPFGYVPAELRGVPAYTLRPGKIERTETATSGQEDRIVYRGKAALGLDGKADVQLVQSFEGKYAVRLRQAFSELPEARIRDVIEAELLGRSLRGARLSNYRFEHFDDLDEPLELHLVAEVPHFAEKSGTRLRVTAPFTPNLGGLAALPRRQTPLLISETTAHELTLEITLPPQARVADPPRASTLEYGDHVVRIFDRATDKRIIFQREMTLTAGRVQPGDYADFAEFARHADALLSASASIVVTRGN